MCNKKYKVGARCIAETAQVYVVGDSYTNDSSDFPAFLDYDIVSVNGTGGRSLASIAVSFLSEIPASVDVVIVHAGLNDIYGNRTYMQILQFTQMLLTQARTLNLSVYISNIPPNVGLTAVRQFDLETYNQELEVYARSQPDLYVVDVNSALDTTRDNAIDAVYDSGDGVHPNALGSQKIAELYNMIKCVSG